MTRDEIVTALRCCAKNLLSECPNCMKWLLTLWRWAELTIGFVTMCRQNCT